MQTVGDRKIRAVTAVCAIVRDRNDEPAGTNAGSIAGARARITPATMLVAESPYRRRLVRRSRFLARRRIGSFVYNHAPAAVPSKYTVRMLAKL